MNSAVHVPTPLVSPRVMESFASEYEPVSGLQVHAQVLTQSKMFYRGTIERRRARAQVFAALEAKIHCVYAIIFFGAKICQRLFWKFLHNCARA